MQLVPEKQRSFCCEWQISTCQTVIINGNSDPQTNRHRPLLEGNMADPPDGTVLLDTTGAEEEAPSAMLLQIHKLEEER